MPSAQDLFDAYLNSGPATADAPSAPAMPGTATNPVFTANPFLPGTKQADVATAAASKSASLVQASGEKQAELGAVTMTPQQAYSDVLARQSGAGAGTMPTQVDADVANLPAADLMAKYGPTVGAQLMNARNAGASALLRDQNAHRTLAQGLGDFTAGVGLGVGNTVGGLAALGAGVVSPAAGTFLSQQVKDLNDSVQSRLESEAMQAHRHANAAENQLGYRDNTQQYGEDLQNNGDFIAGLKRIGRDAGTAVGNAVSDPTVLSDGVAQGIGSLVTAGPTGKLIGLGAKAILPTSRIASTLAAGAIDASQGTTSAASLLAAAAENPAVAKTAAYLGEHGSMLAGIGATEAGGAYQQTAADIMDKKPEELAQSSPYYNDLVKPVAEGGQGMTPEYARTQVANRAGMFAAAVQGPLAAVTGSLAAKFEAHPFSVPSLREAGQNILKEGAEEFIQSGTGQFAQNLGTQKFADKDQSLTEGVGEQAGLGGLYGLASAGVVQAPGSVLSAGSRAAIGATAAVAPVLKGAAKATAAVAQPIIDLAAKRGDAKQAANEAASPVSDQAVSQAAQEATSNLPAAVQAVDEATSEQNAPDMSTPDREAVRGYARTMNTIMQFDPAEPAARGMPQAAQDAIAGSKNRVEAMQRMAAFIDDGKQSLEDKLDVAGALHDDLQQISQVGNSQPDVLHALGNDHPIGRMVSDVSDLLAKVQQSPLIQDAQEATRKVVEKAAQNLPEITEQSAATPEGQQAIKQAVTVASISPEKLPDHVAETILKMQSAGKIQLSDSQITALQTARALLDGRKAYVAELEKTGLSSPKDIVAKQISANQGAAEGHESALEHANAIRTAYGNGDIDGARVALNNFGKFAQSLQNKVGAVNAQITAHGRNSNTGNSLHYDAITPDKSQFVQSTKSFGVTPTRAGSVQLMQEVAAEAHALTGIHNALASAYPELKVGHLDQVALHPSLADAPPAQVAKEFSQGKRTVGPVNGKAATQTEVQPQTETPSQSKPEAAVAEATPAEPKQTVTESKPQSPISDEMRSTIRSWDQSNRSNRNEEWMIGAAESNPAFNNATGGDAISAHGMAKVHTLMGAVESLVNMLSNGFDPKRTLYYDGLTNSAKDGRGSGTGTAGGHAYRDGPFILVFHDGLKGRQPTINDLTSVLVNPSNAELIPHLQQLFPNVTFNTFDQVQNSIDLAQQANGTSETVATESTAAPVVQDNQGAREEKAPAQPSSQAADSNQEKVGTTPKVPAEPVKEKTGVGKAYPNLVQPKSGNQFENAFKLPDEARSNLAGEEAPLAKVKSALSSEENYQQNAKGSSAKLTQEVRKAYRALLSGVPEMVDTINDHLQTFLNTKVKGNKNADNANRWRNGKLLNLTEEQADGGLKLNQGLMETAAIAGLQWLLSSNRNGSILDEGDAAEIFGVDRDSPDIGAMLDHVKQGILRNDAVSSLAQKIQNYWGLQTNRNAPDGYTVGIPQAAAAEVLRTLMTTMVTQTDAEGNVHEVPMLTEQQLRVNTKTGEIIPEGQAAPKGVKPKTVSVLIPTRFEGFEKLQKFPDAIERVVSKTPELNHYLDGERPPVPNTQMRNPQVENTAQQKDMIANETDTVHTVNTHMAVLYSALGVDNLVDIFGPGNFDESKLNKNDANSKKGQKLSITAAFDVFNDTMTAVQAHAEATGKTAGDVEIRYGYNMSRVGRLQMLGQFNPQASKLMREVILPTQSTLNLNKTAHQQAFMLGLGQAIGVKVHNMQYGAMQTKTQAALDGQFKPAVEVLRTFLQTGKMTEDMVSTLKASLGSGPSFVQLHGLTEYARLLDASPAERKAFQTKLYLEADGMTNGPINAMALLSRGRFTPAWVKNMGRGGLWFGGSSDQTSTVQRERDATDLYKATSDDLRTRIAEMRQGMDDADPVKQQQSHLLNLMNLMLGDVVKFDGKDTVDLDRGIAKNPLTITIYGSGASGIAGKLVGMLTEKIYGQFSDALANGRDLGTLFGEGPEAQAKLDVFRDALNALRSQQVKTEQDGTRTISDSGVKLESDSLKDWTFSPDELKAIRQNMLSLFVEPMRESIQEVVGESLFASADMVRQATQAQSIFQQYAYQEAVEAALEAKRKNDPNYVEGEYLSQAEQAKILGSLSHLAPLVKAPGQTFYVAGQAKANLKGNSGYAEAFDGTMETPATAHGPGNAGVAGIPFLNIGMGDGKMMQIISTMRGAIDGTLKIFDGMNMPLDKITEGSQQANQAVWQSWMGNPLQAVSDSYGRFLKDFSMEGIRKGSQQHIDLVHALFGLSASTQEYSLDDVKAELHALGERVATGALEAEARHRAMARVNVSVDQMAAASSPYQLTSKESVAGSEEQVATRMSQLYQEELAKLLKTDGVRTESISSDLKSVGQATPSGARVLAFSALNDLATKLALKIPAAQAQLLNQIQKSLATEGYKVIHGTREQLLAYNEQQGANAIDASYLTDPANHGFTLPGRQEIYLISPSSETLTHELIHAATFRTIQAYYNGQNLGEQHPVIAKAIQNMERLMAQFLSMGDRVKDASPALQQAYRDAVAAINGQLNNGDLDRPSQKSQGLNEFMAWALSNQDLGRLQERTAAHPLVQLARDVVDFLKQVIWGRKAAAASPGTDMLSNLQFNAAVVLHTQPSMAQMMRDTALFQSKSYGTSDRLSQLDDTFDRKVTDYIDVPDMVEESRRKTKVAEAQNLGANVTGLFASHFPMTMQEKTTFSKIISALATEAHLDGNVLTRMQQLWSHVTKNLTVEHFLAGDPHDLSANGTADRYQAQQKFDTILGNNLSAIDGAGRSTLLPAFMALSVTNDPFRDVLSKMPVPKAEKSNADSRVDALLENTASSIMDALSRRISGEGKSENLRDAMDALSDRMVEIAQDRQSYMDQFLNTSGGLVDAGNAYVTQAFDALSKFLTDKADALDAKTSNRLAGLVSSSARLMAAVVSEENAGKIAEGVMAAINSVKGFRPFTDFVGDLVGRTMSNAAVYDMIKTVRSMIAQDRQQFREIVPKVIAEHFSRELTDDEWSLLHRAMGKSDLASLAQGFKHDEILKLLEHPADLKTRIAALEGEIRQADQPNWKHYQSKMQQLADYMLNGKTSSNLLRNAVAISRLLGVPGVRKGNVADMAGHVKNIDMLTTLYALEHLGVKERLDLATIAGSEQDGLKFTLSYLQGQRAEEQNRAVSSERALFNHYKGYIPSIQQAGASLIIANDSEYSNLVSRSYVRVGDYAGSSAERAREKKGYYFLPVSGHNVFNQGILQNVRQTASGVDVATGYTMGMTAGRITDAQLVTYADRVLKAGRESGTEHLLPVYGADGKVVAFERSVDPTQLQKLQFNTHLAQMIGVWRGRQVEEGKAAIYNDALIGRLHDMYESDMNESAGRQSQYVNVFDPRELAKDPVLADAVKLITPQMRERIEQEFGQQFFVRRDMLNDALGYRSASVGDAWTGTSRWSDTTQNNVKRLAMSVFGNKAYQYTVNAEKTFQNFVGDVKSMIVVKSIVVPVSNLVSNAYQLASRGVPLKAIITGMPKKTAEVQAYVESEVRRIAADAELRAAEGRNDVVAQRKLKAEIQSIEDSHRRMSIWPLIEAGEFSAISDGRATPEDVELTSGRLHSYIEGLVDKLPQGVKTAGRYALITKDTALFQGMQKATEYGDFLAKAILYDDLTRRQGKSKGYALSRVTEEYVNYDRLPGRFRGYLESMGLLWFYNFKIRSTKVALSMIRNNPVHALLAGLAPTPDFLGSVGLPTSDNLFTKLADGKLNYSFGFGQIFHAPMLNPWVNLVH